MLPPTYRRDSGGRQRCLLPAKHSQDECSRSKGGPCIGLYNESAFSAECFQHFLCKTQLARVERAPCSRPGERFLCHTAPLTSCPCFSKPENVYNTGGRKMVHPHQCTACALAQKGTVVASLPCVTCATPVEVIGWPTKRRAGSNQRKDKKDRKGSVCLYCTARSHTDTGGELKALSIVPPVAITKMHGLRKCVQVPCTDTVLLHRAVLPLSFLHS